MKKLTLTLILGGLLIAACGGAATPTVDVNVPVVTDDFAVVAEGRLLPAQYASLSFETGGKIAEVLVVEGQAVSAEDVIARLENS